MNDLVLATGLAGAIILVVLLSDELTIVASRLVDEVVLRKALSSSFEERSRWTMAGLDAFYASGGLGIGAGSARTSNGFVNLLASTGILGALFLLAFTLAAIAKRAGQNQAQNILAVRLTLLPVLTGFLLAGTSPDYGTIAAVMFGLAASAEETNQT